jgi:hypothetical protein
MPRCTPLPVLALLTLAFAVGAPVPAQAEPVTGCHTVGVVGPDGVDRYVTVCVPPTQD